MPTALNESVLRALLAEVERDADDVSVVGVLAEPLWPGSARFQSDSTAVQLAPCASALAVREAVATYDPKPRELLVILTNLAENEIGEEMLARMWRGRLIRPSRWDAAKALFRVDRLDPALADLRWVVDLLVEVAPLRGYPPPPSGLLDLETAWQTLLRHGLRITSAGLTVLDLLRWGTTEDARSALSGPVRAYSEKIAEHLQARAGPVARHILRLVGAGRGADLVPLGLVCEALWGSDEQIAQTARIRFETPVGSKDLSPSVAQAWGRTAVSVYRAAVAEHEVAACRTWAGRAEAILRELDAESLAIYSTTLPAGFQQRLALVGSRLQEAVMSPDPALRVLDRAVALVEGHVSAEVDVDEDRVRRVRMAARLATWLTRRTPDPAVDFREAAARFVADGAWVDAAREAISHGETIESLGTAYGLLEAEVDARRRTRDLEFGRAFAEWNRVLPTSAEYLLPIERVLDEVVAPVARETQVLVLVLDGLSYPEFTRLARDITDRGWSPQGPQGRALPLVVAAVPTVTVVSRATLLSGSLTRGGQDIERTGFEEHRALRAIGMKPPRLFHKRDLRIEEGHIAQEVHETILDTERSVVAVVVNAVDDHLAKGAQLRLADGLRGIRPLRPLLDVAAEAGRVVILASDHGHINEYGCQVRPHPGAGERWRPSGPPLRDDEVEITGPRVLEANGTIVAPAVDRVRYIPMEKKGYHGGATPQEVLCPLAVFATGNVSVAGWEPVFVREPSWWSRRGRETRPLATLVAPETVVDAKGQVELFKTPRTEPASSKATPWLIQVLESRVMVSQKEMAGRQALDDESLQRFLSVLYASGGVASAAVMVDALDLPPSRLRTKLEALRRMLNVEGYPVVKIESDNTVRLNLELLRTQFEVDA